MPSTPAKSKNPVGRPPITTKNLPSNWKELIIDMAMQGMSDVEIRANLCITIEKCTDKDGIVEKKKKFSYDTWYAIKARESEFAETLQIAKVLCQAWWEEAGRIHLYHSAGLTFETGCWYANMKNRFGWRDKNTVEHELGESFFDKYKELNDEQLTHRFEEISQN